MLRYPPEATGYSQRQQRRSYPKPRTDFLPPAYALLTWEIAPGTKERHGQDHEEGCRGGGCPREGLPNLGRRAAGLWAPGF